MKRYHRSISILLLMLACTPAMAQNDLRRTMAEELLVLLNVEANLAAMRDQMGKLVEAQVAGMELPEDARPRMVEVQKKIFDMIFDELSWKAVKEEFVDLYATTLTQEELAAVITFYRTPMGQSFLSKQPKILQQSMEIGRRRTAGLMPRLQSLIEESAREIQVNPGTDPAEPK